MKHELLVAVGEVIGHKELLKLIKESKTKNKDLKTFVDSNPDGGGGGENCQGHEGECGTCRGGVWYPCF